MTGPNPERRRPFFANPENAPDARWNRLVFQQIVSWSTQENRPISLGEWVASRFPERLEAYGLEPYTGEEPAKGVGELTPEELKEMVAARVMRNPDGALHVFGGPRYTMPELAQEIKAGSSVGQRTVSASRRSVAFLEKLFELGKVTITS